MLNKILECYPGNKKKLVPSLPNVDLIWSPYLGSGVLELNSSAKTVLGAEWGAMKRIWNLAQDPVAWHILQVRTRQAQAIVREISERGLDDYLALKARNRRKAATGRALAFAEAMDEWFMGMRDKANLGDPFAFYVLSKLTFGGYMRSAELSSDLNVLWTPDKIKTFLNWKDKPTPINGKAVEVFEDGLDIEIPIGRSPAMAIIDPPYYAGPYGRSQRMTPAYIDHRPHDLKTLRMMEIPLTRAIASRRFEEIWVFNYDGAEAQSVIDNVCDPLGLTVQKVDLGALTNSYRGCKGKRSDRSDTLWKIKNYKDSTKVG